MGHLQGARLERQALDYLHGKPRRGARGIQAEDLRELKRQLRHKDVGYAGRPQDFDPCVLVHHTGSEDDVHV